MKFILRLSLSVLFVCTLYQAAFRYEQMSGGALVLLMFYILLGAIFFGALWAPYLGSQVSAPLTSMMTEETTLAPVQNNLILLIQYLQARRCRRLALTLCFLEGLRYPNLPHPALLGLRNCRPGSRLEKWFAREVYRYDNIKNCLYAYTILKERHGVVPAPHRLPEVNLAIRGLTRTVPPEPSDVKCTPNAIQIQLERNHRIKLFED